MSPVFSIVITHTNTHTFIYRINVYVHAYAPIFVCMYLKPRFYLQDKTCLSFLNLFTLLNRTFFSSTFSQIISVILGQWKSIVCSFYLSICLEMGIKTASQFCKKSECVNISHIGLEYPFLGLLQGAFSRVNHVWIISFSVKGPLPQKGLLQNPWKHPSSSP